MHYHPTCTALPPAPQTTQEHALGMLHAHRGQEAKVRQQDLAAAQPSASDAPSPKRCKVPGSFQQALCHAGVKGHETVARTTRKRAATAQPSASDAPPAQRATRSRAGRPTRAPVPTLATVIEDEEEQPDEDTEALPGTVA